MLKWLGRIGGWIDATVSVAFNWQVIVSAVAGVGAGVWAWGTQWGYLPIALTALGVFVAVLWAWNGIIWLRSQRRPTRSMLTFDYSYGLSLEDVIAALDLDNEQNTLEIRLKIRNLTNRPIKVSVERLHIIIEDRFYTIPTAIGFILARVEARIIFPGGGFGRAAYDAFKDRTSGTLEFVIIYGHPEDIFVRRAEKNVNFSIAKHKADGSESVSLNWIVREETDKPLDGRA